MLAAIEQKRSACPIVADLWRLLLHASIGLVLLVVIVLLAVLLVQPGQVVLLDQQLRG